MKTELPVGFDKIKALVTLVEGFLCNGGKKNAIKINQADIRKWKE